MALHSLKPAVAVRSIKLKEYTFPTIHILACPIETAWMALANLLHLGNITPEKQCA